MNLIYYKNISMVVLFFISSLNCFSQSPFKLSSSNDLPLIGSGLVIGSISLLLNENIAPFTVEQINNLNGSTINKFDRSAIYNFSSGIDKTSDILVGFSIVAPTLLLLDPAIKNDWQIISTMYFETALFATFIPRIVKLSTERTRPFIYNPKAPLDQKLSSDARHSFFSGHTTWGFASAVFLSSVYGEYFPSSEWKKYIWTGSLLIAGGIGYLRYEAGYHYPTDIIAGAAVGMVCGYIIPLIHKSENYSINFSTFSRRFSDNSISIRYKF
ncbi:MAG: phosphatase PAP2 family protein [Ignavibacteriales bacterium]|nr:phosphatase PAP2 family protein [Ignavibacteriales bacterium]